LQKYDNDAGIISALFIGLIAFAVTFALLSFLVLILGYYNYWRYSAEYADKLTVSIEGPYLRIIECRKTMSDRKIHFNQLMDYTIIQDRKMKRLNMKSLRISTNQMLGNGRRSYIEIPGIVNIEKVRDQLAEYDYKHENEK
jgi:hypothetical protein